MAAARKLVRKLPVVVILGATGTGKSKLAIEMAMKFNGEILSADSMQVYKGLDIVTNKVTPEETAACPHHMISYVNPLHYAHTVVDFRDKALPLIDNILARNRIPIIVGGTNYYIEALLWEMLVETDPKKKSEERPPAETVATPSGDQGNQTETSCTSETTGSSTSRELPGTVAASGEERIRSASSTTPDLFAQLQDVDPASARRIHPNDRRKITRALEVFRSGGRPLSVLLAEQHATPGGGGVSGPLRYHPTTVFSLRCDRQVLDERTDRRVDQMIDTGLIDELSQFHDMYNQSRLQEDSKADYTQGIFQSIGFKEFHEYLLLNKEERNEEKGKALFNAGVEEMKRVTRRYARKQTTWFNSRFLKRRGSAVPPVYGLDTTIPARWQQEVQDPAVKVMEAVLKGEDPPIEPLPCEENTNLPVYNRCDTCDLVFVTTRDWQAHIQGRRHKNRLKRKKRTEEGVIQSKKDKRDNKSPTPLQEQTDKDNTVKPKKEDTDEGITQPEKLKTDETCDSNS